MSATISTLCERALIERIRARSTRATSPVHLGIGDDAAVLEPERGAMQVLTTDSLIEGVHFRRDWTTAEHIGHKALAVNLSDLAAMGATPRACLLSLALPGTFPLDDFDALVSGFTKLADASGAVLIGGNLTESPGPVMIDVTAIGYARRRRLLRRDAARAGDELYVTGWPGMAATGLAMLTAGVQRETMDEDAIACVARLEHPDARWRAASTVARSAASSAAIDLSDGLADAARRLAEASGIGIVMDGAALPIARGVRNWASHSHGSVIDMALAGGEDYELAFAVSPRKRRRFLGAMHRYPELPVTMVGKFVKESGTWIERDGQREPLPDGFSHFHA